MNELGDVCEGTGSNIFFVRNERLETPPLSSGCLGGVTRALVIELATRLAIPFIEHPVPSSDLTEGSITEVFLTSTTRDVHPVSRIGSNLFATPGTITKHLRDAFHKWQSQDADP
jgi:branched-chain amino acid aminotransferase